MSISLIKKAKDIRSFRKVPLPHEFLIKNIKYNYLYSASRPPLLKALCLYVTYRCNMRCRICGIWRTGSQVSEMSLIDLENVLSDPLFTQIEFVNINGGEPNLRKDLTQIVRLMVCKLTHLNTITLNTNGLPTDMALRNVKEISRICQKSDIRFSVSVSLHDLGKRFDTLSGIEGAFPKVVQTIRELKKIQKQNKFFLSANCVISNYNLFHVYKLKEWCKKEGIHLNFTLGEVRERFNNESMNNILIKADNKKYLIEFLYDLAKDKSLFQHHAYRYHCLADMLKSGTDRPLSCHYLMFGAILGADGTLYYCKDSKALGNTQKESAYKIYFKKENLDYRKNVLMKGKCKKCPPNTFNRFEFEKDIAKYLFFFLKKKTFGNRAH